MTTETEKFLTEYKRLENVLRDQGLGSVLDYENSLVTEVSLTSEKLKVCRIQRNFIAHNDTGGKFICISPAQTAFIKRLADKLEAKQKHVKDIMTRQKAVTMSSTMKEVLAAVTRSKSGYAAITDKDGIYLGSLDSAALVSLIAKKGSIAAKLSSYIDEKQLAAFDKKNGIRIVSPDMRADEALAGKESILIVADKNEKYKGII